MLFLGILARLLVARLLLYKDPRHRTLVAKERKVGAKASRKPDSGKDNSEARDHPNVSFVVRCIR